MSEQTFLEQFESNYRWGSVPAKRSFKNIKRVNKGMLENHRLALTLNGVIDRSLDDVDGLQVSDYETYQIFEKDDLVFKLIDLENIKTSRVGYVPRRGIMSSAYIRLSSTSKKAVPRYYYWLFYASYLNNIFNGMGGGVRQNLTPTDLLEFPIPLTPRDIQKEIANFLDRETSRIDQLIEKKQRLVELLDAKYEAFRDAAVCKGVNPKVTYKESGVDWLGLVPDHWTVCRFNRLIFSKIDYRGRTPEKVDEGIFLVTARNIRPGKIDYERSQEFTTKEDWEKLRARGKPEIGDVLFTTEAPLGNVAQVNRTDVAFAQRIMKFRANPALLSNDFLAEFMMSASFQRSLNLYALGSTAPGIKSERMAHLFGLVPPRSEQDQIVRVVRTEGKRLKTLVSSIQRSIDRSREFRTSLITEAVTGQLDIKEWKKK